LFARKEPRANEGVRMVVGDLIKITNTQTTGFENGTIGILTKMEVVNRGDILYWVFIGSHGKDIPFWKNEIGLLN
jgi:hypothetical protein